MEPIIIATKNTNMLGYGSIKNEESSRVFIDIFVSKLLNSELDIKSISKTAIIAKNKSTRAVGPNAKGRFILLSSVC